MKLKRLEDLFDKKSLTPEMAMFMEASVKAGLNIIVSGEKGSGKTTLLNVLASFIPNHDWTIVLQRIPELEVSQA